MKRQHSDIRTALGAFLLGLLLVAVSGPSQALAHKAKHTPEQLKAFEQVFLEQVRIGDLLFHGDGAPRSGWG